MAKTEDALRAKVPKVCRLYCAQVWDEALNQVGVEASSVLRMAESVYYPPPIHAFSSNIANPDAPPDVANPEKRSPSKVLPSSRSPPKVAEQPGTNEKVTEETKVVAFDATKPLTFPQDPAKEKEAPRMELVLATLPIPSKGDPTSIGQGRLEATIPQSQAPPHGKIVIKKK